MAAVSSVMAMAGMTAAPAAHLSSSSAFESSVGPVQQCGFLRLNKAARKMNVAVRASSNEDQVPAARRESLKALVAAGAALALTLSPMSVGPASAGLFDKIPLKKVAERGATSNFPRNEGTGDSVGNNQAPRNIASGTPFGEGSKSGSGVNFNAPDIVNDVKGTVKSNIPDTMNPLKDIGNLNPFKSSSAVGDAKDTASSVAGLFEKNVSVERGISSNFPGNEGTGNSVGNNQGVRGAADSGTSLGEGAGRNLVGNNQASRNASSNGTPFGEGNLRGSGVTLNTPSVRGFVEDVKSNIPNTANPLKDIGSLNPFKGTSTGSDVSAAVGDVKNAASNVAEDVKSNIPNTANPLKDIGSLNPFKGTSTGPDVSGAVSDAKNAASNVAGLFDKNVSVERGTTWGFPGNEGSGSSVANNQGVRGSASSGTPLGEGAGGNLVGNNQASRNASSTGTPFSEGSSSGSGVALNIPNVSGIAEDVKNNIPNTVNPLKDIGNLNPFKGTASVPDVSAAVGDAKNAVSNVASDVKGQAMNNPVADGAKTILNKGAGVPNPQLNPIEDGKQLINKNSVGSIGDVQSAAEGVASDAQSKALNNPIADGAKTFLNKVAGVPDPQLNPIEDGKQLINKNIET